MHYSEFSLLDSSAKMSLNKMKEKKTSLFFRSAKKTISKKQALKLG